MGHKSETGSTSANSMSNNHHRGRHHRHHHHRSSSKKIREPSVHSLSSSDLSTTSSGASSSDSDRIHARSTPKIAAALIAAVVVVAALVGVTVYLVDGDRFSHAETDAPEASTSMERHISDDGSHKVGINVFRQRHHDQRLRFRDGKDPEGPEESLAYYYDDIQEAEKGVADFTADEHGSAEAEMESGGQKSGQVAGRNYFGRHHQTYQQQQRRRQDEGEGVEDDSPPYGARIEHDEHGGGHHWAGGMYDMEPFRGSQFPHFQEMSSESSRRELKTPPDGSRGGIHVAVDPKGGDPESANEPEEVLFQPEAGAGGVLKTLDRRPGRPAFHHMGPTATTTTTASSSELLQQQQLLKQRQRQKQLLLQRLQRQEEMLLLQQQQQRRRRPFQSNPILEAKRLLTNLGGLVELARGEASVIQELARNLTEQAGTKKKVSLKDIMNTVNKTLRNNPNSAVGRLMTKFYDRYLSESADDSDDEELNGFPSNPVHEKSLSSLLFLSFGIFLLNSVNKVIKNGGEAPRGARAIDLEDSDYSVLDALMRDPSEVGHVEGRSLDDDDNNTGTNEYVRLLLNLWKAYQEGDEKDLDCLWSLYCRRLNGQAALGGAVGSVARINGVGVRVLMRELSARGALRSTLRSLMDWEDVDCKKLFPKCIES